jgi:trigger factor
MQVEISKDKEKSEVELKISVGPEALEPHLKEAAKQLSKDKPLKGFRPGKAPVSVVEEAMGKERLFSEALDKAVPKFFIQAVLDNDVDALERPSITVEELDAKKGLKFTAKVAVLPEVTLGDFSSITVEKRGVEITDKDIEQELNYIAKMRSEHLDIARPAQKGDTVMIDFKIMMNGVVIEGGESKNHAVNIGEGHFVPGFEEKLVGISAGDEREFTIKFPDDYAKKGMQGKEAQVWAKAQSVKKQVVPEINDEFAKKLGKFESLNNLKDSLKDSLVHEREQKELERFRGEMSEKLAEAAQFTNIPEVLIDKEIDRRIAEFAQMLTMQNNTIEGYLKKQNKEMADMRKEMREGAEKSVKVGLSLRQLAKQENITVEDEELNDKVQEYLKQYASTDQVKKEIDPEELKDRVNYVLRNQKAMERLEELIEVKKVKSQEAKSDATPK